MSFQEAQPPLEFIPPAQNPWFLRVCQLFLPSLIHWKTTISHIEADNAEVLLDFYRQFHRWQNPFSNSISSSQSRRPMLFGHQKAVLILVRGQLLPDLAKIRGGNFFQRPTLGKQSVKITIGEPISVL